MKDLWNKILLIGAGCITLLFAIYYLISRYNYPVVDNKFSLKFLCFYGVVLVAFIVFCFVQKILLKKGKRTSAQDVIEIFTNYRFLMSQLVNKEFKVKYRRSYLGIAWSLVNPLLMMIVVSAVFSFVFRFNIEKFPAYLILGQIMFNFFSEATQFSLISIIGSGQLIKKVYMPKYIFPLSKTVFSFYNFLITFIPAIIVLAYYKVVPTISVLFLPLFFVYFFLFTFGVGMLLATAEVFLRDVQHLYGVLLLALGYATPIFYPADSLSPKMQLFLNFNPLYHFVKYFRNVLFYHKCPTVEENIVCLALGLGFLIIGVMFFERKQKKFILYI